MATSKKAAEADHDPSAGILYPLAIAVAVLGLLFGFAFLPRLFKPRETALVGKAAPDFSLELVANATDKTKTEMSLAELKGKPVILDFWATWCGPCKAQSPILDSLAQRYADRGLVVVGVDTNDAEGAAASWVRAHHIQYPIVFDKTQSASALYGVENLPTLVVVSREGKVVAMRVGLTDAAELESILKQVL
jgi:thiol-disulfide isomerase/thioredoxin